MRPGKSLPMEMCSTTSDQQRREAWDSWMHNDRLLECALRRIAELEKQLAHQEQDF